MSITTAPQPHPPAPPAKGSRIMIVILALALAGLAVATTAAIVLAVLYYRHVTGAGGGTDNLVQKEAVSPKTSVTGIVHYPTPYALAPNLKLTTAEGSDTVYDIVKEDETGFTWTVHPARDDFQDDAMLFRIAGKEHPDFTWEAKGMRVDKGAENTKVVPQEGIFNTVAGQEAEVHFTSPYMAAPNVELEPGAAFSQGYLKVILVETTPTGFKWKNVGANDPSHSADGPVKWKAKAILAK